MIYNDVLRRHMECLLACQEKEASCRRERKDSRETCGESLDLCGRACDFDHAP